MPLHWSTGHGHVEAVRILLEVGKVSKINTKDKEGWTPLHRCCQQPPPKEKPKDGEAPEPLDMNLEDQKRSNIVKMLMSKGVDVEVRESNSQNNALHLCAMNGYAKVLDAILSQNPGLTVDPVNKISKTPLMYACMEDHLEAVRIMLKFGADPLKKDMLHNEWNPLHFAIMQDNADIVRTLVEDARTKGTYQDFISVKDAVGRLPLVVAEDHFKSKVAEYLKQL